MEGGQVVAVTGNTCPRGEAYARSEVTDPRRILTTTVPCVGGNLTALPVKTRTAIPKGKLAAAVSALLDVVVTAPVFLGEVILPDVAGTGVDIIATRDVAQE